MEKLVIPKTNETPEVVLDLAGKCLIKGVSTPYNVNEFYQPVFDWIKKAKDISPKELTFEFFIDYVNTSSSRVLVDLIKEVNAFRNNGSDVNIVWLYDGEDEDMREFGEELETVTNAQFNYKAIAV